MSEYGPEAVNPCASTPPDSPALVHPPETNVQQQLYPYPAGADDRPKWYLDPFETANRSIIFRHSGWAHDRRRVYDALRRTEQSGNRISDFTACGRHAYVFQSVEEPDLYTLGGSTCHDRFCLPCGRERSRVIAQNVKTKVAGKKARFLTLTLKSDTEPLAELLAKLTRDFTALRRTKLWRKRVTGGVAFLEVKWKENTQRWHVHLHALLQGRYVPRLEVSKTWLKITGTSEVIDIRIVENERHCTHYICKYASKPLDRTVVVEPLRLDEAVLALKGKRLCLTFGSWRGFKLTQPPESGTWIQLGTLDEIIAQAEEGDPDAQAALDGLKIEYAPSTRAPPTRSVATVCSMTFAQHSFNFGPEQTRLPDAYGTRVGKP